MPDLAAECALVFDCEALGCEILIQNGFKKEVLLIISTLKAEKALQMIK